MGQLNFKCQVPQGPNEDSSVQLQSTCQGSLLYIKLHQRMTRVFWFKELLHEQGQKCLQMFFHARLQKK